MVGAEMKRINGNELIWFLILFAFSGYLFFLIISGDILFYVHPRSIKFTTATALVFTLLTILQVKKITAEPRRPLHFGYLIFILPLILAWTVAPQGITEEISITRGINVLADQQREGFSLFFGGNRTGYDYSQDDVLVIEDHFFEGALNEIRNNLDQYENQKISLYGFIFRHEHFDKDTFFISRLLITCCAADAMITGILARLDQGAEYDDYEWVEVSGIIERALYYDVWQNKEYEVPVVRVKTIKRIDKPLQPYVYPSGYTGPEH